MVIEHIIAGYSIPHNEGAIPLTKESYDIREPQKRLSDYSKTITIPENNVVNQIFEHAFDVNILFQTFDPNIKTSYQVVQDGVTLINGFCRLVDIVNVDGKIEYKIQATGKIGSVFESIKDLYLTDIDFSDLNHVWNEANIVAAWSPTIGTGYTYPMIDYGGRTSYSAWTVEDFKPAIFVKEYMTRIFSEQGYTISSAFFNTTLFKSLIVPYAADQIPLDNDGLKAKQFYVTRETTDQTVGIDGILIFNDDIAPNYNTALNEYDITTGIFTAQEVNIYAWQGVLDVTFTYTETNTNITSIINQIANFPNGRMETGFFIQKHGGATVDSFTVDIGQLIRDTPLVNGSTYTIEAPFSLSDFTTVISSEYALRWFDSFTISGSNGGGYYQYSYTDFSVKLNRDSILTQKIKDTYYAEGDTIVMTSLLPKEVKQSDFVGSIIKRFNLYLDYDAIDENLIYIEPRDDYYTDVQVEVSSKVDRSKEIVISPIGALDASTYLFEDKEDKDVKNKSYQDTTEEVYGRYKVDIDNDFIKNESKITTIFSPTPLISVDGQNDRVISAIQFEDDNQKKTDAKGNIRLLYWGGLKATSPDWTINGTIKTTYPYAGHLDNPYAPTFDLNWGVPKKIFYDFTYGGNDIVIYPNANCYNTFWRNYIEEITSKDSKLLTCYVALRPVDYADYNFRQSYYIDGEYWRLVKIVDYDPNSSSTTKCIFLKQHSFTAFAGTTVEVLGGEGTYTETNEPIPRFNVTNRPNGSGGRQVDVITFGDNVVSGWRSIIVSDNITGISTNKNLLVVGSDGSDIQANNTTLLNSPNMEVIRDNEIYLNGLFAESRVDIQLDETLLENLSAGFEILPALRSNEAYEILRGYVRMNGVKPTIGNKVSFKSSGLVTEVASVADSFFDTDDNTGFVTIPTLTSLLFAEAINISAADFESPAATTVQIQLVYRIIRI